MGLLVKDRFRHSKSIQIISPSSATVIELLKCSATFHGQLKFFALYKMGSRNLDLYSHWLNKAFDRFKTLNTFIRNMMIYKRNQFLLSATWEQYFVLTLADVQFLLLSYEKAASLWNTLLDLDSRSLLWVDTYRHFLEVTILIQVLIM